MATLLKRIAAIFFPQYWGGPKKDHAYPAGDAVEIDVTDGILKMSAEAIRCLSNDSYEADALVDDRHDHGGPFSVQVRDQVEEFFKSFGIDNLEALTDEKLAEIRKSYGIDPIVPESKKLFIPISTSDEFQGKTADYSEVELSVKGISRIKQLSKAVKNLQAYKIVEFDFSCAFMVIDWEDAPENGKVALKEFEGSMELIMLNVTDTGFYWSGVYKHTDVRWSTATVPLTVLDEPGDHDLREAA